MEKLHTFILNSVSRKNLRTSMNISYDELVQSDPEREIEMVERRLCRPITWDQTPRVADHPVPSPDHELTR